MSKRNPKQSTAFDPETIFNEVKKSIKKESFEAWSIGMQLRVPLGGGRQSKSELSAANLRKRQALLDLKEIEIAIVIDADGDYIGGSDVEAAQTGYAETYGTAQPTETIILKLRHRRFVPIVVSGTLPQNEDGTYRLEIQKS